MRYAHEGDIGQRVSGEAGSMGVGHSMSDHLAARVGGGGRAGPTAQREGGKGTLAY